MALIELNDGNFRETYENNDIIIIDFWAPWCGPCKAFGPIFEAVAAKHDDIVFGKVNTEAEQALAAHFNVRSIPTIMVIREQIEIFYQPGMLSEENLEELIGKIKELDMDEVRKQVEAEEAKANSKQ